MGIQCSLVQQYTLEGHRSKVRSLLLHSAKLAFWIPHQVRLFLHTCHLYSESGEARARSVRRQETLKAVAYPRQECLRDCREHVIVLGAGAPAAIASALTTFTPGQTQSASADAHWSRGYHCGGLCVPEPVGEQHGASRDRVGAV
jgi:hypothetical protein